MGVGEREKAEADQRLRAFAGLLAGVLRESESNSLVDQWEFAIENGRSGANRSK